MQLPAIEGRRGRFGPFSVDLVSREVHRDGHKINLQDKPFQILAMLLERPGELVTREQIRERLWPADTFVDFEHSINTAIKKLREALENGDDATRYIETLPKRGYRLIATVEEAGETPGEVMLAGGTSVAAKEAAQPSTGRRRRLVYILGSIALAGLLLVAVNTGGSRDAIRRWRNTLTGFPKPIRSLAVLPLQNLSTDANDDYFADGLTDALITDLGKVSSLRVISRTSVLRYKQSKQPLSQIAHELDVDAVIEGTVLRSGDKLRVTVQLIRVLPEEHLWAERYERDISNVIALEKDLALAIAHEVTGHLTTAEETAISNPKTTNPKAYDAYLHGRYLWKDRTQKAAAGAGAFFEQALQEDPNFALAYSGLADYYTVSWGDWVNVPRGLTYARRAVELGPDLAETHASLGIALQYQCAFAEAGKELQRAVELNQNYAMGHHWFAIHLYDMGRAEEALAENERARRLDPFSLPINYHRTVIFTSLRQYERAMEQADIVAAFGPNDAGHRLRADIYWAQGRVPEAIAEEKAAADFNVRPRRRTPYWDEVERIYATSGPQAALRLAAGIDESACTKPPGVSVPAGLPCDPGRIASFYHLAGDKEKALYWLKRGIEQNRTSVGTGCWVARTLETGYDDMRSDPRFQEILRGLGLPE